MRQLRMQKSPQSSAGTGGRRWLTNVTTEGLQAPVGQQREWPPGQRPRAPRPFCGTVCSSQQSAWGRHPGLPVRRACGLRGTPLTLQCSGAAPRVSENSARCLWLWAPRVAAHAHPSSQPPFVLWFHASGSLLPAWPRRSAQRSAWGQRRARQRSDPNRFPSRQAPRAARRTGRLPTAFEEAPYVPGVGNRAEGFHFRGGICSQQTTL